jgi:hypothetical protein
LEPVAKYSTRGVKFIVSPGPAGPRYFCDPFQRHGADTYVTLKTMSEQVPEPAGQLTVVVSREAPVRFLPGLATVKLIQNLSPTVRPLSGSRAASRGGALRRRLVQCRRTGGAAGAGIRNPPATCHIRTFCDIQWPRKSDAQIGPLLVKIGIAPKDIDFVERKPTVAF